MLPLPQSADMPPVYLGIHWLGLPNDETTGEVTIPESLLRRLICHALLHSLPDTAIAEAVQSLTEMREFHLSPRVRRVAALPPARSVVAKIGDHSVRPTFVASEE